MSTLQLIAELGGVGALAPLVGGMFSSIFNGWREAIILTRGLDQEDNKQENEAISEKLKALEKSTLGKRVVWFIVIVAMLVLSAGVWVPTMGMFMHTILALFGHGADMPTLAVQWYWPTEGSFLFWNYEKLKVIHVGAKEALYTIAILPTFISISANVVSFFLINRVRKKLY